MRTVPPCPTDLVRNFAIASEQIKARDYDEDIPRNASGGVLGWDGLLGETRRNVFWLASDETKFIDKDDDIGSDGGVLGVVQPSISVERGSNPQDVDVDVFGIDYGHGLGDSDRVSSLSEMRGSLWLREYSHVLGSDKDDNFEPFLNPVKIEAALDVATDGDVDYMGHEGYNFSVGDFVWCKFESHPWWPGRIYDPNDASEYAASLRLKNHYLVVYFGGGTFAWCNHCQLRPFEENFQKMVTQSNSKAFINAIKEALGDIGQVLEFKMASFVAREGQNTPCRSLAKNYAIKEGVLMPEVGTNNLANILFKPAKLLVRVQQLARIGRITNVLQLEMIKVHLSAFCYYKGGYGLPTYEEPTRLTAYVDTKVDAPIETLGHVVELIIQGKCEEPVVPKFDEASVIRKCTGLSNGRSRTNRRRKQKSIAEILKDGRSDNANKSVPVEQGVDIWDMPQSSIDKRNSQEEATDGVDIWDKPQSSIDKMNSQEEATDGVDIWDIPQSSIDKMNSQEEATEGVDVWDLPQSSIDKRKSQEEATDYFDGRIPESSGRRQTKISCSTWSDPTNQIAVMEGTGDDKATENDAWLGAQRSEVNMEPEADAGSENKTDEPVLSTKREGKGFSLRSKEQTQMGQLSRERKKSKYLCYPFISPNIIEADIEGTGDKKATEDGTRLGSETSEVKIESEVDAGGEKNSEEAVLSTTRNVRSFGLQSEEQNQTGSISRERKKSKYLCYPFVSPNTIDACGLDVVDETQQPERNPMDAVQHISSPRLIETSQPGLSIVASFCKEKDNSILQTPVQCHSNVIDRTKMKASSSCEVLSEIFSAAVNTPFEKEYTFSDVAMHFMHKFRSSSFLDGSLYAVYHEYKLGKKRNNGAFEFGSSQRDPNQNGESISIHEPEKKKRTTNLDYQKKKSSSVAKRKGKRKKKATSPATMFLTFGPESSSPSKADLINIYGKFGPLNETETEMFCDNFCARVSFVRRSDAEEALRYSRSTILFGSTKVNYYLHYPSAANNTGQRARKPKHKSSQPNNPSVGETTADHPVKLLKIRQDLVMMNSMLQASGGEVSPRTKTSLENDIEALLKKVNTMVDSSTF